MRENAAEAQAESSNDATEPANIDLLATQPIDMILLPDQKPPGHP